MQSLEEIELRASCRSENWCFLYVSLHLPARRGQFKQVVCDSLWVDFDAVFSAFSEWVVLSAALHSSHFCC